ncbi:hypothetical protein [Comamonas serinivorans]|nr:hypothetical protein [Comamonas serinivorans]
MIFQVCRQTRHALNVLLEALQRHEQSRVKRQEEMPPAAAATADGIAAAKDAQGLAGHGQRRAARAARMAVHRAAGLVVGWPAGSTARPSGRRADLRVMASTHVFRFGEV